MTYQTVNFSATFGELQDEHDVILWISLGPAVYLAFCYDSQEIGRYLLVDINFLLSAI